MIENVEISLQARSKTGRYYGPAAIREKLDSLDGVLFKRDDGTYYLRTTRIHQTGRPTRIVIIFEVTESTAHVITQTSDHYDWNDFRHVQNPDFSINITELSE